MLFRQFTSIVSELYAIIYFLPTDTIVINYRKSIDNGNM